VDESIGIAVIGLDEAKAFRRVKPLHGSCIQNFSPLCKSAKQHASALESLNDGLESSERRRTRSGNLTRTSMNSANMVDSDDIGKLRLL
jgi:hypothetical protein